MKNLYDCQIWLQGYTERHFFSRDYQMRDHWAASREFGTYRLCEQRRFRQACASAQSRQNLRCSLIQAVSQEEPSDRKPDPWPLWMARYAQLKFVMTECSKTQIRLTRPQLPSSSFCLNNGKGGKSSPTRRIQYVIALFYSLGNHVSLTYYKSVHILWRAKLFTFHEPEHY